MICDHHINGCFKLSLISFFFSSGMARPAQNIARAVRGPKRDSSVQAKIVLLRSEGRRAGPRPTQPSLCPD